MAALSPKAGLLVVKREEVDLMIRVLKKTSQIVTYRRNNQEYVYIICTYICIYMYTYT